jgi:hypothetical protein
MREIIIIIIFLFSGLTDYGQSKKDKKLNSNEIFGNALGQYLKFVAETKPTDTFFIELNDTLNFNLPSNIKGIVIKVSSFDSLLKGLVNKSNAHYYKLRRWPGANKIDIILYKVSVQYSNDEIVAITDSEIHRMTYLKTKGSFLRFKKIEKGNTGCRYFHKVTKDGRHSFQSICT